MLQILQTFLVFVELMLKLQDTCILCREKQEPKKKHHENDQKLKAISRSDSTERSFRGDGRHIHGGTQARHEQLRVSCLRKSHRHHPHNSFRFNFRQVSLFCLLTAVKFEGVK